MSEADFTIAVRHEGAVWEKILRESETLLWHGRPQRSFYLRKYDPFRILIGMVFLSLPPFLLSDLLSTEDNMLGVGIISISILLGAICFLKPLVYDPIIRSRTLYALTPKRAMIAYRSIFGKDVLKSYGINATTQIKFREGDLATIDFAVQEHPTDVDVRPDPVSFENIPDGSKVFALFRQIQSEAK